VARVQVCQHCGAARTFVAAIREMQDKYGARVNVEFVACLDECHNLPVIKVDGQLVYDATPQLIRTAIERAVAQESPQ
jgi:NADH:ubiquinone oxidoreductase subunit E